MYFLPFYAILRSFTSACSASTKLLGVVAMFGRHRGLFVLLARTAGPQHRFRLLSLFFWCWWSR